MLAQLIHNPDKACELIGSIPNKDLDESNVAAHKTITKLLRDDALSWESFCKVNNNSDWAVALLTEHEVKTDPAFWFKQWRRIVVGEQIKSYVDAADELNLSDIQDMMDTLSFGSDIRTWDEVDESLGERILTGLVLLDTRIHLRRGWTCIIAGETSVGKSIFSQNVSLSLARQGRKVMFVNLEMTDAETRSRLDKMDPVLGNFKDQFVFASKISRCSQIRAAVRRVRPDVVVVDYLQLMSEPGHSSRAHQVAAASRGLKAIARDESILILVISSLSRKQDRKRAPILNDLKESGDIEYDADAVLFIHAPNGPVPGEREVICAKQRGGPVSQWSTIFRERDLNFVEATMHGRGDNSAEEASV
jgi:replicative DNA helicase